MAVNDFALNILGTSFSISVDEQPAYLEEIFRKYHNAVENTRKTFNLKDPLVIAVLTGFLLSDELHRGKKQGENSSIEGETPFKETLPPATVEDTAQKEEEREVEELALSIIARIDRVLEDESAGRI